LTTIALKLNSQLTIRKYAEKSERNEMDRACGTYGREEICIQRAYVRQSVRKRPFGKPKLR